MFGRSLVKVSPNRLFAVLTFRMARHVEFVETRNATARAVEHATAELAPTEIPIILRGESGSGKRTLARRIHECSARRRAEFVALACGGLTPQDFVPGENSLLSRNGTLYLEEIADLSPESQNALLEALIQADGTGNGKAHARLICGTSRESEQEANSGEFNEDLYHRLNAVSLRVPPLRHRRQDIGQLMIFFLSKFARELNRTTPMLSEETQQLFVDYAWPGNIRELADVANAIVALGDETLAMSGLRAMLSQSSIPISLREAARAASREAEREIILRTLARMRWNRRRAAQELKISYKALLYKLKQIGDSELEAS